MATLFTKILNGEIPGKILYQDDKVFALQDINPQTKLHFLIIPKKELVNINSVEEVDEALMGHLFLVANKLAKEYNVDESGYRLVINTNKDAGQEVFHIHMHFLAGEKLGRMC